MSSHLTQHPTRRRALRLVAAPFLALFMVALTATSAQAAPIDLTYDADGSTTVSTTGSTIALGPTELTTTLEFTTGEFTGSMVIPTAHTTFKAAGFIPMSADVSFIEAAPVTGAVSAHPEGGGSYVSATAHYYVRLSNVKAVGFPTFVGSSCQTENPVVIDVATPEGERFHVFAGGNLSGTYEIGDFENCGLMTWLVNALVPGSGNGVTFTLSDARRS